MRKFTSTWLLALIGWGLLAEIAAWADAPAPVDLVARDFRPFAAKYCDRCHNEKTARGELNLTAFTGRQRVVAEFRRSSHVIEFIRGGQMPPEDEIQPSIDERKLAADALESVLSAEAERSAGDPGLVLPRRLSNTEYDRTIRDLTGIDIRPTKDFPPDPAGGEGFDNTGEALAISPSLLKKYLAAAQSISEHLVLTTEGITFAPFPVTSYNERRKLTEQAIIDFYQRHDVKLERYLEAAWRYRHRREADRDVDIATWAAREALDPQPAPRGGPTRGEREPLSGSYLSLVWETLQESSRGQGLVRQIGQRWEALQPPETAAGRPGELDDLQRWIESAQRWLGPREEQLIQPSAANWPIAHLAFRARVARGRDRFDANNLRSQVLLRWEKIPAPPRGVDPGRSVVLALTIRRAFDDAAAGAVIVHRPSFSKADALPRNEAETAQHEVVTLRAVLEKHAPELARRLSFGKHPDGGPLDADSFAIKAPATIEFPLAPELLGELVQKRLLAEIELDPREQEGSVLVAAVSNADQTAADADATVFAGENAAWLIHRESEAAKSLAASAQRFCEAFPQRFFYVDRERGLAAGFHLVEGFFRDDRPLVEKVLDERQRAELDQLWRELEFVTQSTETLLRGFVWFERSERHVLHDERFDFLHSEDPALVEEPLLARFERVYLGKLGVKLKDDSLEPEQPHETFQLVHGFFAEIRRGLDNHREQLRAAETRGLAGAEILAERAYRRRLRPAEVEGLRKLYQEERQRGQGVEASLRGLLVATLMSPSFFLHFRQAPPGPGVHPLADDDLASRLSYFLWSSLPDEALRRAADEGRLQQETELLKQTRRMIADERIESFAREFFGQWLRYRDYLVKDAVNAAAFPGYDDTLREAMFDEPVRLATWLIQHDHPITELLDSDVTFVNGALAAHYGGAVAHQYQQRSTSPDQWHLVRGIREEGRGGLLGMGVILAKTSKSERTSPVKRGFWTVHYLLGQHFPPPPAEVPELPPNERQAEKTIRELIVAHTANAKCAICHVHFDSLGMALEGFDPIGRLRTRDLADRPVDNLATLPSGETARGVSGLIEYIERHRRQDFIRTLCRKFLGYALGRSVILSDGPLLTEMERQLESRDGRFSALFETVVQSPQFRQQRGRDFVTDAH